MGKYRDIKDLGTSETCPFKRGESSKDRHARRLKTNTEKDLEVMGWAASKGFTVSIKNNNHHWKLISGDKIIDWWPSSAKLIFNQQWNKGMHCHDTEKLIQAIENRWNLS